MFRGLSGSRPIGVASNLKNCGINAVYLGAPWLGLPNRVHYLPSGIDGIYAPPEVRAEQSLRNTYEFFEAFGINEGDPMNLAPTDRVRNW
jgi:predicted metalloendopeptidase